MDPQQANASIISSTSYNHLAFRLVEHKNLETSRVCNITKEEEKQKYENTAHEKVVEELGVMVEEGSSSSSPHFASLRISDDDLKLRCEGEVIESFLSDTASQLTYYGLMCLYQTMKDRELGVFFRNNHFCTLFRFEQRLFLLCTDQGYLYEPFVVWELLDEIDGNTVFVNSEFSVLRSGAYPSDSTNHHDVPRPMHGKNHEMLDAIRKEEEFYRQQVASSSGSSEKGESDEDFARRINNEQRAPSIRSAQQANTSSVRRQTMKVRIPDGVRPGASISVVAPNGVRMHIRVPEGSFPGDEINVEFPLTTTPKKMPKPCIIC